MKLNLVITCQTNFFDTFNKNYFTVKTFSNASKTTLSVRKTLDVQLVTFFEPITNRPKNISTLLLGEK